jgi:peptidyl-prolyl cis-trans isomerase B (cyclophilin B)
MENKLITYLPITGIVITIGLLLYNFSQIPESTDQKPLENVIKNINNSNANSNVNNSAPKGTQNMDKTKMEKPTQIINLNNSYTAKIKTSLGDIKVKLYNKSTPTTVNNFVYLAKNKFYDGTIFHRVIKDFMIQGGDPLGNGTGGPGYSFKDEMSDKKLVKGSIAMANSGPNTNGSQFFIVSATETPWLNGKHTNFGEVIEGLEVVEAIQNVKTGAMDKPLQDVVINSIEIIEE